MARCHALEQEFFRNLLESSTGLTKKKLRPCSNFTNIAKRMGVDASYVSRVANGENQSENLRRALLSELGLMQGAA